MGDYNAKVLNETVHHYGKVKWFEDIVNMPDGVAIVDMETFMLMKAKIEKGTKKSIEVKYSAKYTPQNSHQSFAIRLKNWRPPFKMPPLIPYKPKIERWTYKEHGKLYFNIADPADLTSFNGDLYAIIVYGPSVSGVNNSQQPLQLILTKNGSKFDGLKKDAFAVLPHIECEMGHNEASFKLPAKDVSTI